MSYDILKLKYGCGPGMVPNMVKLVERSCKRQDAVDVILFDVNSSAGSAGWIVRMVAAV